MMYEAQTKGLRQGIKQGIELGIEQGLQQGIEQGLQRGQERGIQILILDNLDEGFSKEKILTKLQKRFDLTKDQAEQHFQQFSHKK